MFVLKQLIKNAVLPPALWIILLILVLIFWRKKWARKAFLLTLLLILSLHSGLVSKTLDYFLETRYPPLVDCRSVAPFDAIVLLMGSDIPAEGLIPFPSIAGPTFRRLEETLRLYLQQPKPIIVSGGHANPFTLPRGENKIVRDYLIRWGIPSEQVIPEANSRDTFESALEVKKILQQKGWRRYLLVTSARHMPRSMLAFKALAAEPIAAPGDFTVGKVYSSPMDLLPTESAAADIYGILHEYVGLINYSWRVWHYSR